MRTAQAVAMGDYNRGDIFPQQVQELIWHLTGTLPSDHPAYGVLLQPEIDTKPELWMLGSSDFGGALAARLGIRFAFAHFINPHVGQLVAQQYRTDFEPGFDARPYSAAAVFVIAAESEAEARRYEAAVDLRRLQMALGVNGPIPTVEQGEAHQYTERDQAIVARERPRSIIGTPESVAEQMHALKDRFVADELIVLTVAPSYKARMRSYELLAEAFALPSPASATQSSACPA
jgi:luciferase family oxidoreductase group 1